MDITLHFVVEKDTKGAVRYKEVNSDGTDALAPQIGTLYVRKSAIPGKVLDKLTVTVKWCSTMPRSEGALSHTCATKEFRKSAGQWAVSDVTATQANQHR